ncbi:MAG: ATP-dependent Clp protease ATP-binding subunit ClpC [Clostridiales bacterium]|jgi:ATP-dependent Clp protease ATP-binding subunit ClpC|nr:ATP-dependent Clp protease ATP-binding subunit ClpC [Clostridiales bacterium]
MFRYNFDEHANDVINYAFSEARHMGHRFVGTEHLMLGLSMLKQSGIYQTFEYYKITTAQLRTEIVKCIGRGEIDQGIEDYTPRARLCLEQSRHYAALTESQEIMAEHLFISIMQDKESNGYKILSKISLNVMNILDRVFEQTISKPQTNVIKQREATQHDIKLFDLEMDYDQPAIDVKIEKMTTNLTEFAKEDVLGPVFGRETEINRLIQILTRKTKNNPCLVGEPGIGKTAVVHGLAKAIVTGAVPASLASKQILSVNAGALVAGTMYRGQFEERLQQLIDFVKRDSKYILFFDEIHTLIGLGATGEKSMDAISLLKPYLTSGEIQIIGATTVMDYEKYIAVDSALSRRLVKVTIDEPDEEQTMYILEHVKHHYETHHEVVITEEALKAAVKLSTRYLLQRKLPDKAIDIIDEACSRRRLESLKTVKIVDELRYRLQQFKAQKEQAILTMDFDMASQLQREEKRILDHIERNDQARQLMAQRKLTVDVIDVEHVISDWANIPVQRLSTREREQMRHLEQLISEKLIGQPQAVDIVSRALKRSRVGLKDHKRPVGSFLFIGPTGVGKTEMTRIIAEIVYGGAQHTIRFDMSEYMERHSVSKLIGAPPGYEGHREGGLLTTALQQQPYSVIVFDEVEKAHLDVLNLLLQMMDEGKVTDSRGIQADVRNALIIMTSNLGVESLKQRVLGFAENDATPFAFYEERLREAAKKFFKPEFINRLDEIIVFTPLALEAMERIVTMQLDAFAQQMQENGCMLTYSKAIVKHTALACMSSEYGARPIRRYLDRHIKDVVADRLLLEGETPKRLHLALEADTIVIGECE